MLKTRFKELVSLLLPREHGSWSLALEPVAFGLMAAPSRAGIPLGMAAALAFLMRRPVKVLFPNRPDSRRSLAAVSVGFMGALMLAGMCLAVHWGNAYSLWPLIPAAVAGVLFLWADLHGEWREGFAEISGSIAFAILPAAFGLLAGWPAANALVLAAMMLARSVPTVLFVRTCLRRIKGQTAPATLALTAGIMVSALMIWLASCGLAPWFAAGFSVLLAARMLYFLQLKEWFPAVRTLGYVEMTLGVIMVAAVAWVWHFLPR